MANFWVQSGDNVTCKLASDAQLLDLLRASRLVKLLMVVGRRELSVKEEEMPAIVNTREEEIMLAAVKTGEEEMPDVVNICVMHFVP